MEIKVTNTAPGEYDTDISLSGTPDDVIKETVVLLNAIGDAMAKHSKDRSVKRYYLLTCYTMACGISGKGGEGI